MNSKEHITAVRNSIGTIIARLNVLEKNGRDYSTHKADLRRLDEAMFQAMMYETAE